MKNWRVNLVLILILLFGAAIIGRLFIIQIIDHDLYKALAHGQQSGFKAVKGERGEIFFSGGEILATNAEGKYVFVCPEEVKNKDQTAEKLAQVLSLNKEEIYSKLEKDSLFEKIKSIISEDEETALRELNLEGVYLGEDSFRNYPQDEMASKAAGFVGGEDIGQYGVEGFYDRMLQGKEDFVNGNKTDGTDLYLTLDYSLQYTAEKLLLASKGEVDIEGGQIIVLEPNTGRILALAEYPSFNPNYYSEVQNFDVFQNSSLQKLFEPGSTLKPITLSIALELGKVSPSTTYIDEGKVKIGKYVIENYNSRVFGEASMTEVLEKSINTGAVFAQKQIGKQDFLDYLDRFGLFKPTGVDIQGEAFSENRELKKGYEVNLATASFGQGIEITPLNLVRAFSAIANGGSLVKPFIVEKMNDPSGETIRNNPELSEKIVSSTTTSKMTAMMISVVENGYAKSARIPGYYIAGKTGTAQIPFSALGEDKKGYSDKTWQSFIGFFPAFNPRFLVLVKLDNPKTGTAEYSAVPLFKQMAKYIIDYYSIPPDY